MMSRDPGRWGAFLGFDPEQQRDGATAYLVASVPDRGYAIFRSKASWHDGVPDNTMRIIELVATDDDAQAALWSYCASMDLVAHVEADHRPVDDPVRYGLADPSRLRAAHAEPLWLRLLTLIEAVPRRAYACPAQAVVAVRDATCPWNAGTWQLDLDVDGASCTPSTAQPELSLDMSALGSAFLGGVRLTELLRARRLDEHRKGTAWRLDRALATDPLPWNPQIF